MIDFFLNLIKDALQGAYVAHQKRLSEPEKEVLIECAQDGELCILTVDAFGSWLRASKKDFFDRTDPAIQARYLEAFESLCKRGYVRHEAGFLFRLTGTGFEMARKLTRENGEIIDV
jgi:hypothetical protein